MAAGEPPNEYATKTELQLLGSQLEANTQGLKEVRAEVSDSKVTLKQILVWLRGEYDADGAFEPGLIEQQRRLAKIISGAARTALWLLGATTMAVVTSAIVNVLSHFSGVIGGKP